MWIIGLLITGLIVGALARLALPGRDPMPWWATILLGIAGAIIGGLILGLLTGHSLGFLGAFLGAVLLLALYRKFVEKRPVFSAQ